MSPERKKKKEVISVALGTNGERNRDESMAALGNGILGKVEFVVGSKYRLMRKIGSGSFGDIYLGINITNGEASQP